MIVARWTIGTGTAPRRWFWVYVYDSLESMRSGADAYSLQRVTGEFKGAYGLCQESGIWYDDDDAEFTGPPRYADGGLSGVVRLCQEHLPHRIIAHELVHAACIAYRRHVARGIDLGEGFGSLDNEERFAYIYDNLSAEMDVQLSKRMRKELIE